MLRVCTSVLFVTCCFLLHSKELHVYGFARREMEKLCTRLEKETPGLLKQWLREGKVTEEEAFIEASYVFAAAVDMVNIASI